MIKDIFIPSRIGAYYVFSQRIISIEIGKTDIHATKMYLKGTTCTIEQFFTVPIEHGTTPAAERVSAALHTLLDKAGSYDEVYTTISSAHVVFKELSLPFQDYSKISMVIEFELEHYLPFSSHDAAIDFIITEKKDGGSCTLLAAAVQKSTLAQILEPFTNAGIIPAIVMVDFIGLSGLYNQLVPYKNSNNVLISFDSQTTRIAYMMHNQLKAVRVLPKGITHVAKSLSKALDIPLAQAADEFMRFGLEEHGNPTYSQACSQVLADVWKDIQFTLDSFMVETSGSIENCLLFGAGATIKGLCKFSHEFTRIPCALFDTAAITQNTRIVLPRTLHEIPLTQLFTLCAAIPFSETMHFNLKADDNALDTTFFNRQVITALGLIAFMICALGINSFLQIRKLKRELTLSEREAVVSLKEQFTRIPANETKLSQVVDSAQEEVEQEEKTWLAFTGPARSSFLKYLLELTNKIDKQSLGFVLEQITISQDTMALKARVKSYEALALLEKELQSSPLFKNVGPLEDTEFEVTIMLATHGEDK